MADPKTGTGIKPNRIVCTIEQEKLKQGLNSKGFASMNQAQAKIKGLEPNVAFKANRGEGINLKGVEMICENLGLASTSFDFKWEEGAGSDALRIETIGAVRYLDSMPFGPRDYWGEENPFTKVALAINYSIEDLASDLKITKWDADDWLVVGPKRNLKKIESFDPRNGEKLLQQSIAQINYHSHFQIKVRKNPPEHVLAIMNEVGKRLDYLIKNNKPTKHSNNLPAEIEKRQTIHELEQNLNKLARERIRLKFAKLKVTAAFFNAVSTGDASPLAIDYFFDFFVFIFSDDHSVVDVVHYDPCLPLVLNENDICELADDWPGHYEQVYRDYRHKNLGPGAYDDHDVRIHLDKEIDDIFQIQISDQF